LAIFENEDFAWGFGVPAMANFWNFVIFKEGLSSNECPSTLFLHFFDYIIVPVFSHHGITSGEDNVSTFFARQKHFFEDQIILVVVVDEAGTCDKVVSVFEFLRQVIRVLTKRVLCKVPIDAFL